MQSHPPVVLDLKQPEVSVTEFTDALAAQLRIIREVMIEMDLAVDELGWVITDLRAGSAYVAVEPRIRGQRLVLGDVDRAISAAAQGIRALEKSSKRPKFFNDDALRASRRLAQITTASNEGVSRLMFGASEVQPTKHIAANVEAIIAGKMQSIGSIEGVLVGVFAENNYRISIREPLHKRSVQCTVPQALLRKVLAAFEQRVIARGVIWSRTDGTPQKIEVRTLETIPTDSDLPGIDDVRGILSGYQIADGE